MDPPEITGADAVTIGVDSTFDLTCTVQGNPLPRLTWSVSPDAVIVTEMQDPTLFSQPALSALSIDVSSLGIGQYTATCSAETLGGQGSTLMASAPFQFEVDALFTNLTIRLDTEGEEEEVIITDLADAAPLVVTCSLVSASLPSVQVLQDGRPLQGEPLLVSAEDTMYVYMLNVTVATLTPPAETFQCVATLNVSGTILEQTANTSIEARAVLENITISDDLTFDLLDDGTEVSLVCAVESSVLLEIAWTRGGVAVGGTPAMRIDTSEFGVWSELTVDISELSGVVPFTCTASIANFDLAVSAGTTITVNRPPEFIADPADETVAILNTTVTLNCSAQGYPAPSVAWETGEGEPLFNDTTFTVVQLPESSEFVTSSVLTFTVLERDNRTTDNSTFLCVASNALDNRTESDSGRLIVAMPPGQVQGLRVVNITSDSAVVTWTRPPSLLDITRYDLMIERTLSDSNEPFVSMDVSVGPDMLSQEFPSRFQPFSTYRVDIRAVNLAGSGQIATEFFMTNESGT